MVGPPARPRHGRGGHPLPVIQLPTSVLPQIGLGQGLRCLLLDACPRSILQHKVGQGHDLTVGHQREIVLLLLERLEPSGLPEPQRQRLLAGQCVCLRDAQCLLKVHGGQPGLVERQSELVPRQVNSPAPQILGSPIHDLCAGELQVKGRRRKRAIVQGQEQDETQDPQPAQEEVKTHGRLCRFSAESTHVCSSPADHGPSNVPREIRLAGL